MGKICYLMGKSSSGKDTILKDLKTWFSYFRSIVLYTTRPIRDGETDGVEYHFVDENILEDMTDKGCVIEMRTYHTKCGVWKYFTADDGQIDLRNNNYFMIGTLQSYEKLCQYFGQENLLPIYIGIEDGVRILRAIERERMQIEPNYVELCRRFLADAEDFSEERLKQAGIHRRFVNDDRKRCLNEIINYIRTEI